MSFIRTFRNSDDRYDVEVNDETLHCGYKTEPDAYKFGTKVAANRDAESKKK